MRIKITLGVMVLISCLAAGWFLWQPARQTKPMSSVFFEPSVIEVQNESESPVEVSVDLVNPYSREVLIESIKVGCVCTKLVQGAERVDANGRASLIFEVTPPSLGKQEVSISLETSEGKLVLPVIARGKKLTPPYVFTNAYQISLTTEPGESVVSGMFEIHSIESPGDPWVQGLRSPDARITCAEPEVSEEAVWDEQTIQRVYKFPVSVDFSGSTDNLIEQTLEVIARSAATKPLPGLRLLARRSSSFDVSPATLVILDPDPKYPIMREITIRGSSETAWDQVGIESTADWISTIQSHEETTLTLRVTINSPPAGKSMYEEKVVVHIAGDELVVPILIQAPQS